MPLLNPGDFAVVLFYRGASAPRDGMTGQETAA
jgi:hypothetical protein